MRAIAVPLTLATILAWMAWEASQSVTISGQSVAAAAPSSRAHPPGSPLQPGPLAEPTQGSAAKRTAPAAVRTDSGVGIQPPRSFARLDFVVTDGSRPVEGALLHIDENVESVFDAHVDHQGQARTNSNGCVTAFVRPSRVATVSTTHPTAGLTLVRGVSTPLEGVARTVSITLRSLDGEPHRTVQVVSERGQIPITGASIRLDGLHDNGLLRFRTGVDGRAALPVSEGATIHIDAPGFPKLKSKVPGERSSAPWIAVMRPFARLHGRAFGLAECSATPMLNGRTRRARVFVSIPVGDPMKGLPESSFAGVSLASGLSHRSFDATLEEDGTWEANEVVIPRGQSWVSGAEVHLVAGPMVRKFAMMDRLYPGDDREVPDPWRTGCPWKLQLVGSDGAPLATSGALSLHLGDAALPTFHLPIKDSIVEVPFAGYGDYSVRIAMDHANGSEVDETTGTATNDGSGRARVVAGKSR